MFNNLYAEKVLKRFRKRFPTKNLLININTIKQHRRSRAIKRLVQTKNPMVEVCDSTKIIADTPQISGNVISNNKIINFRAIFTREHWSIISCSDKLDLISRQKLALAGFILLIEKKKYHRNLEYIYDQIIAMQDGS